MIKTFTPNDIIRYVYEETSAEENQLIASYLWIDPELQTFYYEAASLRLALDQVDFSPSEAAIRHILEFSRDFDLHPVNE